MRSNVTRGAILDVPDDIFHPSQLAVTFATSRASICNMRIDGILCMVLRSRIFIEYDLLGVDLFTFDIDSVEEFDKMIVSAALFITDDCYRSISQDLLQGLITVGGWCRYSSMYCNYSGYVKGVGKDDKIITRSGEVIERKERPSLTFD